jgi:hypothetical protein
MSTVKLLEKFKLMLLHKVYSNKRLIQCSHLLAKILVYFCPFQTIYVYFGGFYSVYYCPGSAHLQPCRHNAGRVILSGICEMFYCFSLCIFSPWCGVFLRDASAAATLFVRTGPLVWAPSILQASLWTILLSKAVRLWCQNCWSTLMIFSHILFIVI